MKKNKNTYNPNMAYGINGCLNLFKGKKIEILSIHMMIDGNADKNKSIGDVGFGAIEGVFHHGLALCQLVLFYSFSPQASSYH